jgi:protein-S-isoprenylcysteine O-methyltransferase Ste14
MTLTDVAVFVLAYHLVSRLAYVLYVGVALKAQERSGYFTRRWGLEEGFRRFRRAAAIVMYNDAVSFVVLCLVSSNTLRIGLPRGPVIVIGTLLVLLGVATKLWAAVTLGSKAYYWHDFFTAARATPNVGGPYRFLKNPMYTVGYVQMYGFALVVASLPGLGAALIDQAAILTFHRWVEQPHFDRWSGRAASAELGNPPAVPGDITSE